MMNHQINDPTLQQRLLDSEKMIERLQLALREEQHRCLKEWQLLAALVDIERIQHRATVPVESLIRIQTHIRAAAATHNLLAWRPSFPENSKCVSVKEQLDGLFTLLQVTYNDYDLCYEIEDVLITQACCCALALICSELVRNAIKHGTSKTQVLFYMQEESCCLQVRDDGTGFSEGFDHHVSYLMGLDIVESLCRLDLHGQVRCENWPGGGQVTVTFPVGLQTRLVAQSGVSPTCERDLCLS